MRKLFDKLDQLDINTKTIVTIFCLVIGLATSAPVLEQQWGQGRKNAMRSAKKPTQRILAATRMNLTVAAETNYDEATLLPDGSTRHLISDEAGTSVDHYLPHTELNAQKFVTIPDGRELIDVDFLDEQHGWAHDGYEEMWGTEDGGNTWYQSKFPFRLTIGDVSWFSPRIGYLGANRYNPKWDDKKGDDPKATAVVLRTEDGGRTWRLIGALDTAYTVWQIVAPTEDKLLLNLGSSRVAASDDGGKTWFYPFGTTEDSVRCLTVNRLGDGWLVGKDSFYRTRDYGKTWSEVRNLPAKFAGTFWNSVAITPEGIGLALGGNHNIAVTYDGGTTWREAELLDYLVKFNEYSRVQVRGRTALIFAGGKVFRVEL